VAYKLGGYNNYMIPVTEYHCEFCGAIKGDGYENVPVLDCIGAFEKHETQFLKAEEISV
jgi:hypothetical protein